MAETRVVVFIDYQNTYHCARDLFAAEDDPPMFGHVYPHHLGELLVHLGSSVDLQRVLSGVEVYRGKPGPKSPEKLRRAFDRQVAKWNRTPGVGVSTRPLRYRPIAWSFGKPIAWRGEEKGVDVMMALSIAIGAIKDWYDVAVVVSADTDLVPAMEEVVAVGKRVETATWWSPGSQRRPLRIEGLRTWNHQLDRSLFELVRDDTDYLVGD